MAEDGRQGKFLRIFGAAEDLASLIRPERFINLFGELLSDTPGPTADLVIDQLDILFPFVHFVELGLENRNLVREL